MRLDFTGKNVRVGKNPEKNVLHLGNNVHAGKRGR
jgi:hypothetical protein